MPLSTIVTRSPASGIVPARRRRMISGAGAMLLGGCLVWAGCVGEGGSAEETVTISIAASTQDAVKEIAEAFEANTGAKVFINAASSSALANQILSGAPADLYLSANAKWADAVQEEFPVESRRLLLKNRLVMIVPTGNPADVNSPEDLTTDRVRHIGLAGDEVPAGIYARQALESVGIKATIEEAGKVATGHNVRITLSHVERGEAEAGVVYATDAALSDGVEVAYTFAAETHDRIEYPLLLLASAADNAAAGRLFEFFSSPEAIATFEQFGFEVASDSEQH